jgi:hypothetical protein
MMHPHGRQTLSANPGIPEWARLLTYVSIHLDPYDSLCSIET